MTYEYEPTRGDTGRIYRDMPESTGTHQETSGKVVIPQEWKDNWAMLCDNKYPHPNDVKED